MAKKSPNEPGEVAEPVQVDSASQQAGRKKRRGVTTKAEPVSEFPELKPVKKDLGPTLILQEGKLRISFGTRQAVWPIGPGQDQATSLVTYETTIPKGEAVGFSNLSKEGFLLRGWLLVDGKGQVLGRLANDDEPVYDYEEVATFAKIAGLKVDDWGKVHFKQIDELMQAPRTAKDELGRPLQGTTGREWIMALGVLGGLMITWPFLSNVTYASSRMRGFIMLIMGVSGFLVGAVGLWGARAAHRLSARVTAILSLVLTAIFGGIAIFYMMSPEISFWKLSNNQLAIVFLGVTLIAAVMPFWAKIFRSNEPKTS